MEQKDLEKMIKDILGGMGNQAATASSPASSNGNLTFKDYPLGEKSADKLRTPTGKKLDDVTLAGVKDGSITGADVRIRPETLELQAQVAESMGRNEFAMNLRRAAELIAVPDARILEIYNALRPYRSTKAELYAIATELETKYNCKMNAAHVRESADVCEASNRLKKA